MRFSFDDFTEEEKEQWLEVEENYRDPGYLKPFYYAGWLLILSGLSVALLFSPLAGLLIAIIGVPLTILKKVARLQKHALFSLLFIDIIITRLKALSDGMKSKE